MTSETDVAPSDAGGRNAHVMRTVATETKRRLGDTAASQYSVHTGRIGGKDVTVTRLARNRVHRGRRAFDDRVRRMTTGANRCGGVAIVDQGRVDAGLPLLELVIVTGAADLNHGDGKFALAGDRLPRGGMARKFNVVMAAGTPQHTVDRCRESVLRDMQ